MHTEQLEHPPITRLMKRDPRIWVSLLTLVVTWGVALLNMNGITVSRRSVSADASDWKVMLYMALIVSAILLPIVLLRVLFWKRAKPGVGHVLSKTPINQGVRIQYGYAIDGAAYQGKVSPTHKLELSKLAVGDEIAIFVDPKKPAKSVAPL